MGAHRCTGNSDAPLDAGGSVPFSADEVALARQVRTLSPRARRIAAVLGTLVIVGIGAWVVTLPMRQTRFQMVEHRLERSGQEAQIRGRLRNRGAEARQVLIEAYLYDAENRWLGTAHATLETAPADSVVPFVVPIDARLGRALKRYSLYAGLEPNPLAPGM
ncbi:MAG TPA: hypothetical protein VFH11_08130 [Gemmatimonadota bacterium]|nr:hypothetical protein [Gemmatimonadota bacterium]